MLNNVTKQHYVQRAYLKKWQNNSNKKTLWTYIISEDKISNCGLTSVAQESRFYRLCKLTSEEFRTCETLLSDLNLNNNEFGMLCVSVLKAFYYISFSSESEEDKNHIANNIFEKLNTSIEALGKTLLGLKSIRDFDSGQNLYNTVFYICSQYFRTKKMKENIILGYKNNRYLSALTQKAFPFIELSFALALTRGIMHDSNIKYVLLNNSSEIDFITSDQPAINLLQDIVDSNGNVKDLDLYYPLSPKSALLITKKPNYNKFDEQNINEEDVMEYNSAIVKNAFNFIFATKQTQLQTYKQ